MCYEEQKAALDKAKTYFSQMRFQAPPNDDMKKKGQVHNFGIKPFQTGSLITISANIELYLMLKEEFQVPYLLTHYTSQDELERKFSEIRGLGGGFCLHPTAKQYKERLNQSVKLQILADETFDILQMQERLKAKRSHENDAQFTVTKEELPEPNFNDLEIKGIQDVASKVMSRFPNVGGNFGTDLKQMYNIFNYVHPKDGILDKNNLLTGMCE